MPLDKLIQSILNEAEQTASEIISEANENAKKILQEAELLTKKNTEELKKSLIENCEKESARTISQANLLLRNKILEVRQKWIDKVFSDTLAALQKIDKTSYEKWVDDKLLQLCTTGEETILFLEKDLKIFNQDWLSKVNNNLKVKGLQGNLKISFTNSNFSGGFIIQTPKFEVLVTFDEILQRLRREVQYQINDILFNKKSDVENK